MSTSSPSDLAVAFRSLARRLGQAHDDDTPPNAVGAASRSVDAAISAAAALLRVDGSGEAIATAIEARPSDDWTDDELARLQSHALDAARAIRDLEDVNGDE